MVSTVLQPDCLRWARERAGLSVPDLAKKIGVKPDKVASWEQFGEISWSHIQKLADKTHVPLGYLFLPNPPVEQLPINDFRTVQSQNILDPSPDLLDTINDALRKQDWYREYIRNSGGGRLAFVGSLTVFDDIKGAARRILDVVGWGADLRKQTPSSENFLSQHIDAVEESGVLVMRSGIVGNYSLRPLKVEEFRGFALSDEYAPIIFINRKDAKAAQLFTLAHELVHIWLGVSAVSNLDQTFPPEVEVERFCNRVAAELLVPTEELRTLWSSIRGSQDSIAQAANHFKVSSLVVLRRLYDIGYLTYQNFQHLYAEALTQFAPKISSGGGGNFYRTLYTRVGKRFASALIASTLEGETPYRDAFALLGVKNAENLRRLASTMEAIA